MDNSLVTAPWELVDSLQSRRVDYALISDLAVRAYAIPRPNDDVDFYDRMLHSVVKRVAPKIGVSTDPGTEKFLTGWRDRVAEMPMIKLKTKMDDEHWVDLDVFLCGTRFQQSLMSRRIVVEMDPHQKVWGVTPDDLVLLKLFADRPRDRPDVTELLFVQGQLDEASYKIIQNAYATEPPRTRLPDCWRTGSVRRRYACSLAGPVAFDVADLFSNI